MNKLPKYYMIMTPNHAIFCEFYDSLCKQFPFLNPKRFTYRAHYRTALLVLIEDFLAKDRDCVYYSSLEDVRHDARIFTLEKFDVFIEELRNVLLTFSVEVVLNKEHTAVVSESGVKVGCQTFPLEVVDKLAEAVKKVREN